jgi:hypothetical protein
MLPARSDALRRGAPPAVIPVQVVRLDPATGAVIWSSFAIRTHVLLDPATGTTVVPAPPVPSHEEYPPGATGR